MRHQLSLILLSLAAKFVLRIECNEECCYRYGSVPVNDTNCVPEGEQLTLIYIVYNPRDSFTNFTVTWFKSNTDDNMMSSYEIRPTDTVPQEYQFFNFTSINSSVSVENCDVDVYNDRFGLGIANVTSDKGGYYWCQLAINNTYAQRSHHALFYAGDPNSTTCSRPRTFQYTTPVHRSESQCVQYMNTFTTDSTVSSSAVSSQSSISEPSSMNPSTTSDPMTQGTTVYVAGSLGAVVLLFGALLIIFSTLYLCKLWKGKSSTSNHQQGDLSSIRIQPELVDSSSTNAQITAQNEEDIYSVVSDSFDGLKSSCKENQSSFAMPYEVTIFHGQHQCTEEVHCQNVTKTDSKSDLEPCIIRDRNVHIQQCGENQSCIVIDATDEHHLYDEVKHEKKSLSRQSEINKCDKKDSSELFDDIIYSSPTPQNHAITKVQLQLLEANGMNQPNESEEQRDVASLSMKQDKHDYAEPVVEKKPDGAHLYDRINRSNQSQNMSAVPILISKKNNCINGGADRTEHAYSALESPLKSQKRVANTNITSLAHISTTICQNSIQSDDCNPTLHNCRFDDPMYESNPHPGTTLKLSGDAENFADAPQHSDPSESDSKCVDTTTVQEVLYRKA